jgi:hypothetical protein
VFNERSRKFHAIQEAWRLFINNCEGNQGERELREGEFGKERIRIGELWY